MTLYQLKPRFQALLRPLVRWLHRRGVTANQLTLLAGAGSVALGLLLALQGPAQPAWLLLLPAWLLVRMALNAMDGMLAREFGQASRLGAYLNELCDPVSDVALILPLARIAPSWAPLVVLVAVLAVLTELAGALGPSVGASRRYEGPMGKSDRALVLGALGAWLGLGFTGGVGLCLGLLAVLLAVTVANRVRAGLIEARYRPRLPDLDLP
jgi:CDP-diacylglycerol--glycerol-3-phosphate 3-phosphatidyltransferase